MRFSHILYNMLAYQLPHERNQASLATVCPQPVLYAARLLRAAPPKYASNEREVQRGRRPLW